MPDISKRDAVEDALGDPVGAREPADKPVTTSEEDEKAPAEDPREVFMSELRKLERAHGLKLGTVVTLVPEQVGDGARMLVEARARIVVVPAGR